MTEKLKVSLSVKTPDGKVQKLADDINNLSPEGRAVAVAAIDALNAPVDKSDLFQWANHIDSAKNEYEIELFVFNKNYVPYTLQYTPELLMKFRPLFLYDIINSVAMGAGTGLQVRNYLEASKDDVAYLPLEETGRADTLIYIIEKERSDILAFNNDEHDYKRLQGIMARFTKTGEQPFYIFKQFKPSAAVQGGRDFVLDGDTVRVFTQDVAFAIDPSNQVLVTGPDMFIFNQPKFEALFKTKPHAVAQARKNGSAIDKKFKLSMPLTVQEIELMARGDTSAMKKLAEVDPELMTQDEVIEAADEFALELMTDDAGAIILMDSKDVKTFLDILLDNYVHGATGNPYLAKNKKEIEQ